MKAFTGQLQYGLFPRGRRDVVPEHSRISRFFGNTEPGSVVECLRANGRSHRGEFEKTFLMSRTDCPDSSPLSHTNPILHRVDIENEKIRFALYFYIVSKKKNAPVAQRIEWWTSNPTVGGSNPPGRVVTP